MDKKLKERLIDVLRNKVRRWDSYQCDWLCAVCLEVAHTEDCEILALIRELDDL